MKKQLNILTNVVISSMSFLHLFLYVAHSFYFFAINSHLRKFPLYMIFFYLLCLCLFIFSHFLPPFSPPPLLLQLYFPSCHFFTALRVTLLSPPLFVYFFLSSLSLGYHINGLPSLSAAGRQAALDLLGKSLKVKRREETYFNPRK